ncbi:MAG: hypothetical protein LUQ69_00180 [Methanoregulaceae archaeon]|nr:hypothetical protein [Methanoregulaceae archaeon]
MRPLSSRAHDLYPFIGRGLGMPGDRFLPCPGCGSLLTGETGERLLWECRYCRAVFLVAEEVAEYRVPE